MTYEERSEQIARQLFNIENTEEELGVTDWFVVYNAIALQVEAIREACKDGAICHTNGKPLDRYLLQHGYIEPQNGYIPEKEDKHV